jgi:hypothetical protein
MYAPFECGMKCGTARVYDHEIPGGQYSNLMVQCQAMGIWDKWEKVGTHKCTPWGTRSAKQKKNIQMCKSTVVWMMGWRRCSTCTGTSTCCSET